MEKAVALLSSCLAAFVAVACGGGTPANDGTGSARANVEREEARASYATRVLSPPRDRPVASSGRLAPGR